MAGGRARRSPTLGRRGPGAAVTAPRGTDGQPAVTGAGFSIGTPMRLPYSVHEPS